MAQLRRCGTIAAGNDHGPARRSVMIALFLAIGLGVAWQPARSQTLSSLRTMATNLENDAAQAERARVDLWQRISTQRRNLDVRLRTMRNCPASTVRAAADQLAGQRNPLERQFSQAQQTANRIRQEAGNAQQAATRALMAQQTHNAAAEAGARRDQVRLLQALMASYRTAAPASTALLSGFARTAAAAEDQVKQCTNAATFAETITWAGGRLIRIYVFGEKTDG